MQSHRHLILTSMGGTAQSGPSHIGEHLDRRHQRLEELVSLLHSQWSPIFGDTGVTTLHQAHQNGLAPQLHPHSIGLMFTLPPGRGSRWSWLVDKFESVYLQAESELDNIPVHQRYPRPK